MNARSMAALMVLQMLFAGGSQALPAATSVPSQGLDSVSVSSARSSRAEAVVSGRDAVIDVNGDRVEIDDGWLTLNGESYGRVHHGSRVIYRVVDGEKTLLVDGRVRRPVTPR